MKLVCYSENGASAGRTKLSDVMSYADVIIVEGDCMDLLPLLPPESVSLTITDPPYESLEKHRAKGTTTRLKVSKASSNEWYSIFPNSRYGELFRQLFRVQVHNSHCYVFCDSETEHVLLSGVVPYNDKPTPAARSKERKLCATQVLAPRFATALDVGWIAWPTLTWIKTRRTLKKLDWGWLKSTADGLWGECPESLFLRLADMCEFLLRKGMGYHWSKCTERIVFLEKGRKQLNDQKWPDVFFGPRAAKGEHPSKKPDSVVQRLILNSTQPGEWVLDPFAGSGVVGKQALACDRRAILSDVDLKYIKEIEWEIGKKVVWMALKS